MATDSEDNTSDLKGLSFIDWESLDRDEFVKLERIINDSKESAGVQLPFVQHTPKSVKCHGNTVDIEASVLHPSAPIFQPAIPPPSIMGFPIPMPAWTHRDPNMPSSGPSYPMPMHSGYVFQDPSLSVNREVTVAFVTTLSNGQPVYAFPGHQMPHNFQPQPPHHAHHHAHHHGNGFDCIVSHAGHTPQCHPSHQGDMMMQSVSMAGAIMTQSPTHSLVMGHDATTMPPPGHMMSPSGIPHLQNTQMMYIPHMSPNQPQPTSQMSVVVSEPQITQQLAQSISNAIPAPSKAISGLPPRQKTPVIEFAGPVVFDVPTAHVISELATENKNTNRGTVSQKEISNQYVNGGAKVKTFSMKEVVIDVKCDEMPGQEEPDNSPTVSGSSSNREITPVIDMSSVTLPTPSRSENSPAPSSAPANSDNSSASSTPAAKSPASHTSVINVNSDSSDVNDFPKMNVPSHSPLSPNNALPHKDTNAKDLQSKEKTTPPAPKMWSSLFGRKLDNTKSNFSPTATFTQGAPVQPGITAAAGGPDSSVVVIKPEVKSVSYWQEQEKAAANSFVPTEKVTSVLAKQDPLAPRLLEKLLNFPISHTPIVIQPRGLKNGRNTCFMNATLQVLMGCPPFVHLFRAFKSFPARTGSCSSTPIFDSLVLFVNSFQNGQRAKQSSRAKKGNSLDIHVGLPFSPDPLLSVAQDILGLNIGVQQDAEEFLSQILSICHEELENIMKMNKNMDCVNNNSDVKTSDDVNGYVDNFNHVEGFEDEEEDDNWQRVGPKNHSVETNVNDCGQTPLSSIFAGLSRSCLQKETGKTSDTLDSFFTLKLDIQADSVHSVKEALLRLNTMEIVHDADGRKVHGQRRMFFDVLPPVLIMHLKLFEYSNGNGQKIQKKISFDVDLQIPKEIFSRVGRMKYSSPKARSYKLFGVVNHHGIRMNDGHYTSDVYLPVANGWLHFDDSDVSTTVEAQVLQHCEGSMPYMLFYRRLDAKE